MFKLNIMGDPAKVIFLCLCFVCMAGLQLTNPPPTMATEKQQKVSICHLSGCNGSFRLISIPVSAYPYHIAHGDIDPQTFYQDGDGDGFGGISAVTDCTAPAGFVDNNDDCDDSDAGVNPSANEIPGDGIDNDCNPKTLDVLGLDLVIIPGGGLNEDCSVRKQMRYRVVRAVKYAEALPNPHYMVSGRPPDGRNCSCSYDYCDTEAGAMAQILMDEFGVVEEDITLELEATTTEKNAIKCKEKVDEMINKGIAIRSIAVGSSNFHMHRQTGIAFPKDRSVIKYFNDAFYGLVTFIDADLSPYNVHINTFESSKMEKATKWHDDFTVATDWNTDDHVRTLGDVNGDGRADIVGFGEDQVYVALSNGNGFDDKAEWHDDFSKNDDWDTAIHVRAVGDVNGDGLADLVGFHSRNVFVALSNGSAFEDKTIWLGCPSFGSDSDCGNWNNAQHVRTLGDVNGDGLADLVGFGTKDVWVALSNGSGFDETKIWLPANEDNDRDFTYDTNYRTGKHVRGTADVDGDGLADIWAIGDHGVYVALSTGSLFEHTGGPGKAGPWYYEIQDRHHQREREAFQHFALEAGWSVAEHPRMFGDVDGNGMADLVGFHDEDVFVSLTTEP